MSDTQTMYSLNDEDFRNEDVRSICEELNDCDELVVGAKYYSCEFKTINPAEFVSCRLLEQIDEQMIEEFGESYDSEFCYLGNDAVKEFEVLLESFMKKHSSIYQGVFYQPIGKSQVHKITQHDIDDSGLLEVSP